MNTQGSPPADNRSGTVPDAVSDVDNPAGVELQIQLPVKFDDDVRMPEPADADAHAVWSEFFRHKRPWPKTLRDWVLKLHNEKKHRQVIACLQTALIHGQAQPWMYEVLAMSMEIDGRPREEIERVVSSLSDFGAADFGAMMYSGATLAQFGRNATALRTYRQASRMLPERSEPYVLGLRLAELEGDDEGIVWAAQGVLTTYWGEDHATKHRQAENALLERIRLARKEGQVATVEELQARMTEARRRDVAVRLTWNGSADLDMEIEEPNGSVCSFEQVESANGGNFLHDGVGTDRDKAYEHYVAPIAFSGVYRVTVRKAAGDLVGNRGTVTVLLHAGTPAERKITRTLTFEQDEAGFTFELEEGRRVQPKVAARFDGDETFFDRLQSLADQTRPSPRAMQARAALRNFADSRGGNGRRAGAFGFAPVVDLIDEGNSLTARAVVSPDRRYVRLAMRPTFSDITDVFTFSVINGAGVGTGGN